MSCRYCRDEKVGHEVTAIIPLREFDSNISLFGCRVCMIERNLWCSTHDVPHAEWNAGGHLCMPCLHILYSRLQPRAREYYEYLINSLPKPSAKALREWAEDPENWVPVIPPNNEYELVLWSLAAQVLIRNLPLQRLLEDIAEQNDLESIIPGGFPVSID